MPSLGAAARGAFSRLSLSVLSSSSSEGGRLEVDGRTMVRSAAPHEALLFIIITILTHVLVLLVMVCIVRVYSKFSRR